MNFVPNGSTIEVTKSTAINKVYARLFAAIIWLPSLILTACDAPRDNPFDPRGPGYQSSQPERIVDLSLDTLAGIRCLLSWSAPAGADDYRLYSSRSISGWDGRSIEGAELYQGELPGVKPAGTRQTAWIDLPPNQTRAWAIFTISEAGLLSEGSNVLVIPAPPRDRPAVEAAHASSLYLASWASLPWFGLELTASIADSDGVDSVWVCLEDQNVAELLSMGDGLHWRNQIHESHLPGGLLGNLVGHPLTLHHLDGAGFTTSGEPFRLARVIYVEPEVDSPFSDTLDTRQPRLQWERYITDFNFTYAIEIVHVSESSFRTVVYRDSLINPDSTGHQVTIRLPDQPELLYWTVSVVDDFGDLARSREAVFWVSDGE